MDPTKYYVDTVQMLWQSLRYAIDGVADVDDIKRWIDLSTGATEKIKELLESSSLEASKKRVCQTSWGQLLSIRRMLNGCLRTGRGLIQQEENRVVWDSAKSAFKKNIQTGIITNVKHLDIATFMEDAGGLFELKITEILRQHSSLKVDAILATECSIIRENKEVSEVKYFNTKSESIYKSTNLRDWFLLNVKQPIERDMEEFQERDSGWTFRVILNLTFNIKKLIQMHARSYIPLPEVIQKKQACVNVQNTDNQCFKWAILSALYPTNRNPQRVSNYKEHENKLNFNEIDFPVSLKQIPRFEKQNDVSVNIFMLKKKGVNYNVSPCHVTSSKKEKHINLLLIQDFYVDESEEEKEEEEEEAEDDTLPQFHYVWIKDLSRLVNKQLSNREHKMYICDCCLHYFRTGNELTLHERDCSQKNNCKVLLPETKRDIILQFKNFNNKLPVPIVVYADFECILKPVDSDQRAYQEHEPFSVGLFVKYSDDPKKT